MSASSKLESVKEALQGVLQVAKTVYKTLKTENASHKRLQISGDDDFGLAILMVFTLGLIRKLIERYSIDSSNHAQLLVSPI